ncbi:MAG TPA: group 1 truncated hemoglobin [Planctomycetota bacterium]|nr:group 1 truncated hemoglobin [Planctomycetota bacterium]
MNVGALFLVVLAGCRSHDKPAAKDEGFRTSGSREADQRAEQRISKEEQLRGEGEGGSGAKKAKATLFARLGTEAGIERIVDDFVERAIADPRTNWERKGIKRGGVLGIGRSSAEWRATTDNVARLKLHLAQFIAVATGGPTEYEGRGMSEVHAGMKITNAEFDASIGALKATLDALKIGIDEQKELLAVFESTRPQIAEKR